MFNIFNSQQKKKGNLFQEAYNQNRTDESKHRGEPTTTEPPNCSAMPRRSCWRRGRACATGFSFTSWLAGSGSWEGTETHGLLREKKSWNSEKIIEDQLIREFWSFQYVSTMIFKEGKCTSGFCLAALVASLAEAPEGHLAESWQRFLPLTPMALRWQSRERGERGDRRKRRVVQRSRDWVVLAVDHQPLGLIGWAAKQKPRNATNAMGHVFNAPVQCS